MKRVLQIFRILFLLLFVSGYVLHSSLHEFENIVTNKNNSSIASHSDSEKGCKHTSIKIIIECQLCTSNIKKINFHPVYRSREIKQKTTFVQVWNFEIQKKNYFNSALSILGPPSV